MTNIFQSLIGFIEIFTIGGITIAILAYGLLAFHPFFHSISIYLKSVKEHIKTDFGFLEFKQDPAHPARIIPIFVILGFSYFIGSVSNIASYSFLKHDDMMLVNWIYPNASTITITQKDSMHNHLSPYQKFLFAKEDTTSIKQYYLMPLFPSWYPITDDIRSNHAAFIATIAASRTKSTSSPLEELLKFVRLERAFVMFMALLMLFSGLKLLFTIPCWVQLGVLSRKKPENIKNLRWFRLFVDLSLYRAFENNRGGQEVVVTKDGKDSTEVNYKRFSRKTNTAMWSHAAFFIFSSFFYCFSIRWWYEVAIYYHITNIGVYIQ